MRILVVGAGAIGGYFGGRLLQAGQDVTFLVRPKRAAELASAGLVIKSPLGDITLKNPPTVQADALKETFDVVLLSCKAFDLDDAIRSFAPAVGPRTAIIPMLNGMRHWRSSTRNSVASACSVASVRSRSRSTRSARSSSSRRCSRSASASVTAGRATGSRPSLTSSPAAIADRRRPTTSCRTCGRSGCFWPRWPAPPA